MREWCIAVLVLVALAAGCSHGASETPPPDRVKMAYRPYLSFAPFFVAEAEGCFAERGIEIEYVKITRSAHALPALARGDVDMLSGFVSVGLVNVIARGAPIRIVGGKGRTPDEGPSYTAVMCRPELLGSPELESSAGLRKLRISCDKDNYPGYLLDRLMAQRGLDFFAMDVRHVPAAVRLEAMMSGKLDVVSMSEPWRTRLKRSGAGVVWKEGSEVLPGMQWSFVAFGPTLLQDNPELGRRFMAAYVKGIQAYRRGKTDRNIEILMKHTGLDRETVAEASWPRVSRDAAINVEAFMAFQRWAAQRQYADRILEPKEFWEPSFTEYAASFLEGK